MAGNPKTKSSTAPKSGRSKASTKGVKVGVNSKATTKSTAVMKAGGPVPPAPKGPGEKMGMGGAMSYSSKPMMKHGGMMKKMSKKSY